MKRYKGWFCLRVLGSVVATAIASVGLVAGCGCERDTSAAGLCDRLCECDGCSDEEHDTCVKDKEGAVGQFYYIGCGAEMDELIACWNCALEEECTTTGHCSAEADAVNACAF